ncbi:N-acetylglutaminylglutamine synthetase [Aurantimonas endophytica]|uniref:GNAT-family acetyltransferase (TIGR03103 family) n=1 Tax=Aurantimonas endophytica TaxID=1522175 RepID=A0A7W6MPM5_9HYPH|nr:N-acetylglutaminylglutamine synthetase [Aurantimonas endophytica]MBB4003150.1 GNAT-family acetyltransferase (TIGR03103 family) [Aurantimonas endophytica]MCO6404021.1 N-acetylglutaminylglutamine synthetase [Aurantimonas endophytica]
MADNRPKNPSQHRLVRMRTQALKAPINQQHADAGRPEQNAYLDCGWGRLVFAQTFDDPKELVSSLREEGNDRRDIAFYVRDPHVLLSHAPQELFLDPSHTYRLDLSTYRASSRRPRGYFIRRLSSELDATEVNRIYQSRHMVQVHPAFFWTNRDNRALTYFVAEDETTGAIIGTVTGVHSRRAFSDPENGSSLWCLAVDPQATHPGIGESLVRRLAEHFQARSCAFMDLSVMHDNEMAIALYEKLGFYRVPYFAVKRKNEINEKLFTGSGADYDGLNPYARIIVDEARRRGIHAEVTDAAGGFFRLTQGGRSIHCRESLTDLTSGVAMSICDDKAVTRRVVEAAGVAVPEQIDADVDDAAIEAFIEKHGQIVVKPARGEQGRGIAVGIDNLADAKVAIAAARQQSDRVLLEACFEGSDLRLIVIDYRLVAAALRQPPAVTGDGRTSLRELIERLSRRRAAATGGESRVPLDAETERCVKNAGFGLDDIPPEGERITVRKTANLHTGGTIHDVTGDVHPTLVEAAVAAARAIEIPVTGIDFMVKAPTRPEYVFIEANERPGLANHEPQPTAERFIDLLFPLSIPFSVRAARNQRRKPRKDE